MASARGLLEQERPDVFTQTVAAIPGRGTVMVTLRYDSIARYADGTWELALPLVVAPRFTPGIASGRPTTGSGRNPDTERSPDASRVTPHALPGAGGSAQIAIEFETAVEAVSSPTHEIEKSPKRYLITDPTSDHDLIVRWHAKLPDEGWVESDGFAAALITGPVATPHTATRCRFVLDRAATTRGDGDIVERALVRALLDKLDAKDRAGLATGELRAPADLQRDLADNWSKANAVFDLTRVLADSRPDGAPIVLVTDGLISDDAGAIAAAKKLGVPIHVIGIGSAPNRSLLATLAVVTGGTVRFAIAGDDLAAIARDVISDAANPPAALGVSWGALAASETVPSQLPRVGAGQSQLVLARVAQSKAANARRARRCVCPRGIHATSCARRRDDTARSARTAMGTAAPRRSDRHRQCARDHGACADVGPALSVHGDGRARRRGRRYRRRQAHARRARVVAGRDAVATGEARDHARARQEHAA